MVKKEDIQFLNQLVNSLEEAASKLEHYYNKKNQSKFDKSKEIMLELQEKISEVIK